MPTLSARRRPVRRGHLGQLIRQTRESLGLGLEAVARRAGWSRPYLSFVEAGRRLPEAPYLVRLARVLGLEAIDLLHAAYCDQLPASERWVLRPQERLSLRLGYTVARRLQEQQFPIQVSRHRYEMSADAEGNATLTRLYEGCRLTGATDAVYELSFRERARGRSLSDEMASGGTIEILDAPRALETEARTILSNDWLVHEIRFLGGWHYQKTHRGGSLSFRHVQRLPHAFSKSPADLMRTVGVEAVRQPFVGALNVQLVHLIDRFELVSLLPASSPARDWRLRLGWGRELDPRTTLPPEGVCDRLDLRTIPCAGEAVIVRPLAGYAFCLEWTPAG